MKLKELLPSSLRNQTYNDFCDGVDNVLNSFKDSEIDRIKRIYSIDNSELNILFDGTLDNSGLKDLATTIYNASPDTFDLAYNFLINEFNGRISQYEQNIKKIICIYKNMPLTPKKDGELVIKNVYCIDLKLNTLDESYLTRFLDHVVSSLTTITYSFNKESDQKYHIEFTDSDINNCEQNMRILQFNIISYFIQAMHVDEVFSEVIDISKFNQYVSYYNIDLSKNTLSISFIFENEGYESEFNKICSFILHYIPYVSYTKDKRVYSLDVVFKSAQELALFRLREEISKIPRSIAKRGTLEFYKSITNTLLFSYQPIITLMKSKNENNRVSELMPNIDLDKHRLDWNITKFVDIPVVENFSGMIDKSQQEDFPVTLDDSRNKTLDDSSKSAILDLLTRSINLPFKRNIFVGFNLNKDYFSEVYLFPFELAKVYTDVLSLNKRATDIPFLTSILSLNIEAFNPAKSPDGNSPYKVEIPSLEFGFLEANICNVAYSSKGNLILRAYDESKDPLCEHPFYSSIVLNNSISNTNLYTKYDSNVEHPYITSLSYIEGNKYKFVDLRADDINSPNIRSFTLDDYTSKCIASSILLKLYCKSNDTSKDENYNIFSNYFLIKKVSNGNFEQICGPTTLNEITYDASNKQFSFYGDFFEKDYSRLDITCNKESYSRISKIRMSLKNLISEYENEVYSINVRDQNGLLNFIELPEKMNLTCLFSKYQSSEIADLILTASPETNTYKWNALFNPQGYILTVQYKNGETKRLGLDEGEMFGYPTTSLTREGENLIPLTYGGFSYSVPVIVQKTLKEITIESAPKKQQFTHTNVEFDGLIMYAHYYSYNPNNPSDENFTKSEIIAKVNNNNSIEIWDDALDADILLSINCLCFTAETYSTIKLSMTGTVPDPELEISNDGISWANYTVGNTITLEYTGSKVYFRRRNDTSATSFSLNMFNYMSFTLSGRLKASGSIMSLIDRTSTSLVIPCDFCFYNLFSQCSGLITPPKLPATTLTKYCYGDMFANVNTLEIAPELPALNLTESCYLRMFSSCTALIATPNLPATTMQAACYSYMFSGCFNLTKITSLQAVIMAPSCFNEMFSRCSNLITPPELPATTMEFNCYNGMFDNCKKLTTLPELPATVLAEGCYGNMFSYCESIKISETKAGEYTIPYRIPSVGSAVEVSNWGYNMFKNTGGTFTSDPELNKTYYLS